MRTERPTEELLLALGVFGRGSHAGERIAMLLERGREFSPQVSRRAIAAGAAVLLVSVIGGTAAPRLFAFAQAFEVASIKPSDPEHVGAQIFSPGPGRFTAMTATLKDLVAFAWSVRRFQVSGGPGWLDSAHHDISAKAEGTPSIEGLRSMLGTLLEERFRLKVHRETKELPVYELVAGKIRRGPKLREVASAGLGLGFGRGRLNGKGADMATLAKTLSDQLDRVVVDRTGLTGFYEFTLTWTPDEVQGADDSGPSIFSAIQEQLGLKLESATGPVELLVVDRAEKPDAN